MMLTIEEFCDKHKACKEGRDWALANCESMFDAWGKLPLAWLVWVATRPGVLTNYELRLFVVYCARSVEHLLTDQRSKNAIEVAERFVNGDATDEELAAAWSDARDAAWAEACVAAVSGVRSSAHAAWAAWAATAAYAAYAATCAAAYAADAATCAADDAAKAACIESQASWLRANTRPSFE
jgi:hypothetical protein